MKRVKELDKNNEIYIVCRTGSRNNLVERQLTELGFENVINVILGMSKWTGQIKRK